MPTPDDSDLAASARWRRLLRRALPLLLALALLGGYWLLPIRGQLLILTDTATFQGTWPHVWAEPPAARPGEQITLYVRDNAPWPYVKLLVEGVEIPRDEGFKPGSGPWVWRWRFSAPARPGASAVFYHDCHTGCVERARAQLGPLAATAGPPEPLRPTKLGVVFADPERDWRGRAGWAVALTYMQRPFDQDFSIDGLARQVYQADRLGLRVLVRIAYDQQQALPPTDDEVALANYLRFCEQLARDDRLRAVYGYIIGSGFNGTDENRLSLSRPATPEWYARLLVGHGTDPARTDNVVQRMRAANPQARLLVGPLTPWVAEGDGALRDPLGQPWLNYMNTLVAYLADSAAERQAAGAALSAPDGFAVQAPGRPDAPELAAPPAREPATDLRRDGWGQAQAGFRVYRDWLAIINRYPATRGLPVYIVSTNTWTADAQVSPAQNYPAGWLTSALREVEREPQVHALCWFLDAPLGDMWEPFSLRRRVGRLNDAATEFDSLLQ